MIVKDEDIVYEANGGAAWVWRDKKLSRYVVFRSGLVCSESDSAYTLDNDGLSVAQARADYLACGPKPVRSREEEL